MRRVVDVSSWAPAPPRRPRSPHLERLNWPSPRPSHSGEHSQPVWRTHTRQICACGIVGSWSTSGRSAWVVSADISCDPRSVCTELTCPRPLWYRWMPNSQNSAMSWPHCLHLPFLQRFWSNQSMSELVVHHRDLKGNQKTTSCFA